MILNIAMMLQLFSREIVKEKLSWGSSWQSDRYQEAHPASGMQASPPVASVNIFTCLPPSKWHLIRSKNKHKNFIKHSLCLATLKLSSSNLLHKQSCWHLVKQSTLIPSSLFLEQTASFCPTFALLVFFLELLLGSGSFVPSFTEERERDFPGGSDGKASAYNAGDQGLIPGSGRSPGEGNGNPL